MGVWGVSDFLPLLGGSLELSFPLLALGEAGEEGSSLIRGRSEAEKCWECVSWSNMRETQPGVSLLSPAVLLLWELRDFLNLRLRCKWFIWHLPHHRQVQKMEAIHLWGHSKDGSGSKHCFSAFAWDGASFVDKRVHLFFFSISLMLLWGVFWPRSDIE